MIIDRHPLPPIKAQQPAHRCTMPLPPARHRTQPQRVGWVDATYLAMIPLTATLIPTITIIQIIKAL